MTKHPTCAALLAASSHATLGDAFLYRGLCDASAAAALGADLFVVANDERNELKVYRRGLSEPVEEVDLSGFLGTKANKESDLEGAATIGARIYWISSHGRNRKGKFQERRHRFFATELKDGQLIAVGQPYTRLLEDMIGAPQLQHYRLAEASAKMPEETGAFNIEGLAATPQGSVLIGLRNPAALVIELCNPAEVIAGERAILGEAILLDLGGLAIRSIELVGLAYMIVAGPHANRGQFALYQWSGQAAHKPVRLAHEDFDKVRPEALFVIPGTRQVQILSDDGGEHVKKLSPEQQTYQSITATL
jgi:hypothetical protein